MHQFGTFALAALVGLTPVVAFAQQSDQPAAGSSPHWLDVHLKARNMLIDPSVPAVLHEVMDPLPEPMGVLSPDGKRVAYIASDPQRVKDGHDFDLFVANVDPTQPSHKTNTRRLTTDQQRPSNAQWLPDSTGLVFVAGEETAQQVWYISLEADAKPVQLSDGERRAFDLAVLPSGKVAWLVHKGSRKKEQFIDLVMHPAPSSRGKVQTLLVDQHIASYAFSPDEQTLAWSGMGSLFLVELETGASRKIPLHGVHRQLINHAANEMAWSPDGRLIAMACGFLGGISRAAVRRVEDFDPNNPLANAPPDDAWPRMFAEDKVFFVPVAWTPSEQDLKVSNENFPSPTADNPEAEVSPPPGDQSRPWWVKDLPMRALNLEWISNAKAKHRIENQAYKPGEVIHEHDERPAAPKPTSPPDS